MTRTNYSDAILEGFHHLLRYHPEVFIIGQGLWSPWYVGNSMKDLDKIYGLDRIMDSPVSEDATTGAAIGASLCGYRPIIVHPRVDFMVLAANQIVNQAAKWSHMLGGQAHPKVTIRAIINRGGEQGAQHSQNLQSWFAHVPGLRVVTPATAEDARDLLISSVLCDDPVLYIDDRWCYEASGLLPPVNEVPLAEQGPKVLKYGTDLTLVGSGYSTQLCLQAASVLGESGIDAEVVDLRILNPFKSEVIRQSVVKTGRLCVVDGGWRTCGMAGEVIAAVFETLEPKYWRTTPRRIALPDAPAPTSKPLEEAYYPTAETVICAVREMFSEKTSFSLETVTTFDRQSRTDCQPL